jgi:hypothetical protein
MAVVHFIDVDKDVSVEVESLAAKVPCATWVLS